MTHNIQLFEQINLLKRNENLIETDNTSTIYVPLPRRQVLSNSRNSQDVLLSKATLGNILCKLCKVGPLHGNTRKRFGGKGWRTESKIFANNAHFISGDC